MQIAGRRGRSTELAHSSLSDARIDNLFVRNYLVQQCTIRATCGLEKLAKVQMWAG